MVEQPGDVVVLLPTRGTREQDCEGFRRNCSVYREKLVWTEQLATVQFESDETLVAVDRERGEEEVGWLLVTWGRVRPHKACGVRLPEG